MMRLREELDLNRIYGEDISIEEIIEHKIKPYKFTPKYIEKYIEKYYIGAYKFLNSPKYLTIQPLYKRFLEGVEDKGFKEWFIKDVHEFVFTETTQFWK